MEKLMAVYFLPKINEIYPEAKVTMQISFLPDETKHAIGLISKDPLIPEMTRTFYMNNLDNIPEIWQQIILSVKVIITLFFWKKYKMY